ncbi:MAG TPA: tetratricopeptide repeat protein, partial [Symbiobacteriaceae bacterium]|nr:tetratricopeptide repeat protein [Symbiobacteriaceae bacterium]
DSRALDGDPEAALEYYQQAAAMAPDDPWIRWRLVWAARRAGYETWALDAWRQLTNLRPDFVHDLYRTERRIWTGAGRE